MRSNVLLGPILGFSLLTMVVSPIHAYADAVLETVLTSVGAPSDTPNCSSGMKDPRYERPAVFSSSDGRFLTFTSCALNLVSGQIDRSFADPTNDVFVHDRQSGQTTLVSHAHGSATTAAGGDSYPAGISADGRWILFVSDARTVSAPGTDTNGAPDVYLHDRENGGNVLVSRVNGGVNAGNGISNEASMSADGRYVVFSSTATNLLTGLQIPALATQVYLFDRVAGTTELISHAAHSMSNGASHRSGLARVSADGRYVSFVSHAGNLINGFTSSSLPNVFVRDRQSQTTLLASRREGDPLHGAGIPQVLPEWWGIPYGLPPSLADSGEVFFTSDSATATAGEVNAYAFNPQDQSTRLISHAHDDPLRHANNRSSVISTTADGHWQLLESSSNELVAGQPSASAWGLYLYDSRLKRMTLVSPAASNPLLPVAGWSARMDHNASRVLFESTEVASLLGVDLPSSTQVFAFERSSSTVSLISHVAGDVSMPAQGPASAADISADGSSGYFVASDRWFDVSIVDLNQKDDVHEYTFNDLSSRTRSRTGDPRQTTANAQTQTAGLSEDGRWVLLESEASDLSEDVLDENRTWDVYLFDAQSRQQRLISARASTADRTASGETRADGISADGRWILLRSNASDLIDGVNPGSGLQVILFDRTTGQLQQISMAPGQSTATGSSSTARISRDGQWVTFASTATDLVAGPDNNGAEDVFLYERATGHIRLVSRAHGSQNTADRRSTPHAISNNGRWLLYSSRATNLLSTTSGPAYYVYDRVLDASRRVVDGLPSSDLIHLSDDGRWIALSSDLPLDADAHYPPQNDMQVFLHDLSSGTTRLISRQQLLVPTAGHGTSWITALSADGSKILYHSTAPNLVPDLILSPFNSYAHVYVHDRISGTTALLSRPDSPPFQPSFGGALQLSANGEFAYFNDLNQSTLRTHLRSGQTMIMSKSMQKMLVTSDGAVAAGNIWLPIETHLDGNDALDTLHVSMSASSRRSWLSITHTTPPTSAPGDTITVHVQVNGEVPVESGSVRVESRQRSCHDAAGEADGMGGMLFSCQIMLSTAGTHGLVAQYDDNALLDPSRTLERYPHRVVGLDFSSLPVSYGTRLADNGPRHLTESALFLGQWPPTAESDGPSNDTQDDLTLPATARGETATMQIRASESGYVNAFVDFNRNGQFDLPEEHWLKDVPVQRGVNELSAVVPIDSALGLLPVRFRLASISGLDHLGPAPDGEVEDGTLSVYNNSPYISVVGNQSVLEDGLLQLVFDAGDADGPSSTLRVSMTSSDPAILPPGVPLPTGVPGQYSVPLQPRPDANGTAWVQLLAQDLEMMYAETTFMVKVLPVNDAPSFNLAGNITLLPEASGTFKWYGFASGIVLGPPNESSQQIREFVVNSLHDPDGVVSSIQLQNDGTLVYQTSGTGGVATFEAVLIDDGGVANGGIDRASRYFTITVPALGDLLRDGFE